MHLLRNTPCHSLLGVCRTCGLLFQGSRCAHGAARACDDQGNADGSGSGSGSSCLHTIAASGNHGPTEPGWQSPGRNAWAAAMTSAASWAVPPTATVVAATGSAAVQLLSRMHHASSNHLLSGLQDIYIPVTGLISSCKKLHCYWTVIVVQGPVFSSTVRYTTSTGCLQETSSSGLQRLGQC